ncbi:MAG: D-alanyl-D-alanine carboxypeptidase [Ruminiclostridium sp.]|nr:D-alanyl-D-alanine carboxypeptidase [Ruminiclostridium sp.]
MKVLSVLAAVLIALLTLPITADAEDVSLSAECAVVINADTLGVLYGRDESKHHAMASTTKIMTALLTLEAGDLDRPFTADSMAIRVEGTSMGLREGDTVTRRALCVGMLLPSGNDAANAAAVSVSGSITAFAELMNKRAAEIGMKDTHFVTPSGLDADGHYTTAYDMALLTAEALKNPDFRAICSRKSEKVSFGAPPTERTLYNSNKLLTLYDGCIGVKTGFTDEARRCLVSAAERDGCRIIAVTLNAPDDWNDHRKLLDLGFSRVRPFDLRLDTFSAEVVGGSSGNVTLMPEENVTVGLTENERRNVSVRYSVPEFVYAEVNKGDVLGYADICMNGRVLKRVKFTAFESIERVVPKQGPFGWMIELFSGGAVRIKGL